jgi:hypothetical protein
MVASEQSSNRDPIRGIDCKAAVCEMQIYIAKEIIRMKINPVQFASNSDMPFSIRILMPNRKRPSKTTLIDVLNKTVGEVNIMRLC